MADWFWNGSLELGSLGQKIITGNGDPNGVVTAPAGSLYMRADGSASTFLYLKLSLTGSAGWVQLDGTTATGGAGGGAVGQPHVFAFFGRAPGWTALPTTSDFSVGLFTVNGNGVSESVLESLVIDDIGGGFFTATYIPDIAGDYILSLADTTGSINVIESVQISPSVSSGGTTVNSYPVIPNQFLNSFNPTTGLFTSAQPTWQNLTGLPLSVDTVQQFSADAAVDFASGDNTLIQGTAGTSGITFTLPDATGIAGKKITFKKIDNTIGGVTIVTINGQTIDGTLFGTSYFLSNYMQFVVLQSDGVNWNIVGGN